jgi:hypothetical protein
VTEHDATAAERRAREYLEHGELAGVRLPVGAKVGHAIPVLDERRSMNSWFVPLLVGESIPAFLQLEPDLSLRRSTQFARAVDARDWLQSEHVRQRAQPLMHSAWRVAEPYLSFDGSPDRIAWRVEATTPAGERRVVYVAGTFAYRSEHPAEPSLE